MRNTPSIMLSDSRYIEVKRCLMRDNALVVDFKRQIEMYLLKIVRVKWNEEDSEK